MCYIFQTSGTYIPSKILFARGKIFVSLQIFYPSGKSILRGKYGPTSLKYMTLVRYRVVLSLCLYVFVWLDTSILLNKCFKRALTLVKRVELKCILRGMTNVFYVLCHNALLTLVQLVFRKNVFYVVWMYYTWCVTFHSHTIFLKKNHAPNGHFFI